MTPIYPHLTIELNKEPFFQDLIDKIENSQGPGIQYRREIQFRDQEMDSWFVKHGYTYGQDYCGSGDGYRVKDKSIVTAFALVWAR